MNKKEIRRYIFSKRKEISDELKQLNIKSVKESVFKYIDIAKYTGKYIFMYSSFGGEAETDELASELKKQGYIISYPKIIDDINSKMSFYEMTDDEMLLPGYKGINEPTGKKCIDECAKESLMIVPLVAFDENRNRVGYGKGFYDNYIRAHRPRYTVGIAYDFQRQIIDDVSVMDKELDCIITETRIYGGF